MKSNFTVFDLENFFSQLHRTHKKIVGYSIPAKKKLFHHRGHPGLEHPYNCSIFSAVVTILPRWKALLPLHRLRQKKAAQSVSLSINTSVAFAMGNNWIPLSSEKLPFFQVFLNIGILFFLRQILTDIRSHSTAVNGIGGICISGNNIGK